MKRLFVGVWTAHLLAPLLILGADNTWTNVGGTSAWNLIDANWTSPTVWNNSNSTANVAIFDVAGAGPITVANGINTRALSFTANGYVLSGGGVTFFNNGSGS